MDLLRWFRFLRAAGVAWDQAARVDARDFCRCLHLPAQVSEAWKQRLRSRQKTIMTGTGAKAAVTVERISYRQCLTPVRAFYLDLAQWAIEEPARWAAWAVPCPVGAEEINQRKAARHRKSRMDARTRERLPVLPVLVRAIDERRKNARHRGPGRERRR